jgi:transcriptional regulator with XRE-family HTH domain
MAAELPSAFGFSLTCLRSARGWTQTRLAQAAGIPKSLVTRYEKGRELIRETLDWLLGFLGYAREAADALVFAHRLIFPDPLEETASPLALTPEEQREIDRACLATGLLAAEEMRDELIRKKKVEKAEAKRQEAEVLWERLQAVDDAKRRGFVAAFPDFRSWALAVRVCEASIRAAARSAKEVRELASLALFIAERVPEPEAFRSRLLGYCWAHVANSLRVSEDYDGADRAITQAWDLWHAGADSDLLPEWLLFTIEASLRREQHQFSQALKLLDQAVDSCDGASRAACLIFLEQERVFEQMGDIKGAVAALERAASSVEASGDPHLQFTFRFKTAKTLCNLERHAEAEALLPGIRELAVEQRNGLNFIRVVWLQARVDAGQGRTEEAVAGLQRVRGEFTARDLPYDAALASLDLAVLWLQAGGRTAEVRELALAMGWIFQAKKIGREALAALSLFCEAARQESATVEMARRVIAEIEKTARSASPVI